MNESQDFPEEPDATYGSAYLTMIANALTTKRCLIGAAVALGLVLAINTGHYERPFPGYTYLMTFGAGVLFGVASNFGERI